MSYKEITQASYEATAEEYARKVSDLAPRESIERFVRLLPLNGKMLDIGCGSGRDAKLFTALGVDLVGIDFCANLIALAKIEAPAAQFYVMDIEELSFANSSFDGVWAGSCLNHISKKMFPVVLNKIHALLKEEGHFYLTLKKGSGEVLKKDERYDGDFEKFWAFFEEDELRILLERAGFKVVDFTIIEKRSAYQTDPCLRFFCQKKRE